ncbi:MAG: FG-GAP-like repeat-containing protein [Candidatus Acidiferrales bacterium]
MLRTLLTACFLAAASAGLLAQGPPTWAQTAPPAASMSPTSDQIPLQVIVVRSNEEAQQILARLKNGEDFAALAKEKSIDPTASAGGYMGKFALRELRAELRDALQGMAPGQVSKVTRIPEGYAILKIMATPSAGAENADPAGTLALAARGSVKQMVLVSGLPEAEEALRRFPKPEGWELDPHKTCDARKGSLAGAIEHMNKMLAPENQGALASRSPMDVLQMHYFLAGLYGYEGRMDESLPEFEKAYQVAQSSVPEEIPLMEETLGIMYLHKSEMENDVYREPGERCLFPMRPGNAFKKTGDSEKSIAYFQKYLEKKPGELDVEWLLNLAYMTTGKYPAGVPPKYLLPISLFESKEDVGRFEDVAPQAGLNLFEMAGGLVVEDLENNGLFDVVTSSFDMCAPMHFFHNNGNGTFTDKTAEAGLSDQLGALNMIQTDYNNDGCLDILMLRGGWEGPQRMSLLRNNCNGTFTDVTEASGLGGVAVATQAAAWADINNDGLLDLFVGSENGPSLLFLNKGDGTFQDISHSAGIDRIAFTKGVVAADYDGDGYVDFYVSNLGRNFLYHNNHDNTFSEVAEQAGVAGPGQSFATWFFDYDNDGLADLFVTGFSISVDETVRTYLGGPNNGATLRLYKNLGDGKFKDVSREAGLQKGFMPMGANFGDIDNDGFLDIYLGTGSPSLGSEVPNVLLRNHDGKYFVDVTASSGTGELHKGHGVAFADIDHSGHEAILAETGGATPGDSHTFRLFANPGNANDWISVKLVGVKTNRAAIGARIKVTVRNEGQATRSIYRWVGSGGSFGASPLEQHIGLGKAATIESLEIWWPASKTLQTFNNVGKNQYLAIKEFEKEYTKLERKQYRLGGAPKDATTETKQTASAQ